MTGELARTLVHRGGGGIEFETDVEQPIVKLLAARDGGEQRQRRAIVRAVAAAAAAAAAAVAVAVDAAVPAQQRDLVLIPFAHRRRMDDPHADERKILEDD